MRETCDGTFELTVDGKPTALAFSRGELTQRSGPAATRKVRINTDLAFLRRWAGGDLDWEDRLADGEVRVEGPRGSRIHWLAASGYLLPYPPEDEPPDRK